MTIQILNHITNTAYQNIAQSEEHIWPAFKEFFIITQKTGTPHPIIIIPNKAAQNRVIMLAYEHIYNGVTGVYMNANDTVLLSIVRA